MISSTTRSSVRKALDPGLPLSLLRVVNAVTLVASLEPKLTASSERKSTALAVGSSKRTWLFPLLVLLALPLIVPVVAPAAAAAVAAVAAVVVIGAGEVETGLMRTMGTMM